MAVAIAQVMTEMTLDDYDRVHAEMNIETDPPEGLIFHSCGMADDGNVRIFDVWESQEAFERFRDGLMIPTIVGAVGDPGAPPQQESYELHNVYRVP